MKPEKKKEKGPEVIYTDVMNCPRCCGSHRSVRLEPLRNPHVMGTLFGALVLKWWGMCPETNQPFMISVEQRAI